jgi:hypothetical protein
MLPFGVTIPPTVPQRSKIPQGLMNYSVLWKIQPLIMSNKSHLQLYSLNLVLAAVHYRKYVYRP